MEQQILASFDGFILRPVTEQDYPALEEWIAKDPFHASMFEPDFFMGREVNSSGELAPDPRATCYALEDSEGTVFFIRMSRAARVQIQFPPEEKSRERRRIAKGLMKGMAFLEVALSRAGAEEWIFESESPRLRHLAEIALGFAESPHEMVRPITRLEALEKPLLPVQQKLEGPA